jgi:hypothetical protein
MKMIIEVNDFPDSLHYLNPLVLGQVLIQGIGKVPGIDALINFATGKSDKIAGLLIVQAEFAFERVDNQLSLIAAEMVIRAGGLDQYYARGNLDLVVAI